MFNKLKTLLRSQVAGLPLRHSVGHWPFDQPRNGATLTMRQVLDGSEPILLVSHATDDHSWQFIGRTDACVADGRVVSLESMVARDPGVLELADLPPGWEATRRSAKHPWERRPSPPDEDVLTQDRTA